jgi:hypothetical protein
MKACTCGCAFQYTRRSSGTSSGPCFIFSRDRTSGLIQEARGTGMAAEGRRGI